MDKGKDPQTVKPYTTTLVQLYSDKICLKAGKINDLKAMARKYIPTPQKDF